MKRIDKQKVSKPTLNFSDEALKQIALRLKFEPLNQGKVFRIHIDGKGCDGFTYGAYFTGKDDEDFSYQYSLPLHEQTDDKTFLAVIEPFTAFYSEKIFVDYHFDPETDDEGFIVTVKNSQDFSGKFFNQDTPHLPPEA